MNAPLRPCALATLLLCLALLFAGCTAASTTSQPTVPPATLPPLTIPAETEIPPPAATEIPPSPTPAPTIAPTPRAGLPLPADRGALFAASGVCAACHTNLVDAAGNDVSLDSFWRSTMMANAARDPYWQATVRSEVLTHPQYDAIIQDKCTTCHTPMAHATLAVDDQPGLALDAGLLDIANPLHALSIDGISCTLCHQIQEDGFGALESFSGHYAIDTTTPAGERVNFGPYPVPPGQAAIMQMASGYIPVESAHVARAELCATCHTLYTPYVDAAGEIAGEFPEQTPYLEWLHSAYVDSRACQDCHMPTADGAVQISTTGGPPRSPFFQHTFVGGNTLVLNMLNTYGEEQAATASSDHFQATIARAIDQMQNRTATVTQELAVSGGELTVDVTVQTQVGHKFPSGFPSRRAWLHLTVSDAAGQVLFESGAVNPDGSIAGNDNDADPDAYEPHYLEIDSADQVQIYESIMQDPEGGLTTTLLRGAGYVKDNRLLPAGFDPASAEEAIAVHGAAAGDANFSAGGDRIRYRVDVGDAAGPFTVTVELLYQSIGYRWAQNLAQYDAVEPARFLAYYDEMSNLPIVVVSATAEVAP